MSGSIKGAVFISYAREDSVAADRLAEALRSHGLEVWFDQNELAGGDAWDGKIRVPLPDAASKTCPPGSSFALFASQLPAASA